MNKTLRYYISKDKQVKPFPRISTPRYQKGGKKASDNYREVEEQK